MRIMSETINQHKFKEMGDKGSWIKDMGDKGSWIKDMGDKGSWIKEMGDKGSWIKDMGDKGSWIKDMGDKGSWIPLKSKYNAYLSQIKRQFKSIYVLKHFSNSNNSLWRISLLDLHSTTNMVYREYKIKQYNKKSSVKCKIALNHKVYCDTRWRSIRMP